MRECEHPLLEDFLYEAIYVPEGFEGDVPRSIVTSDPKCRAAYLGFGERPDDRALVAEVDNQVVGACWVRTTDEYGHIDDETPSVSISLLRPYRGQGIGSAMIKQMLEELGDAGYVRSSLSVQKENPALRLYERLGFRIIGNGADETEWLMVYRLGHATSLAIRIAGFDDAEKLATLRIGQLLEEGAQESFDLRPALIDHYARHFADDSFVSWIAIDGERIVATSGLSIVEKPPYFGCPTGKIGLISSMFTLPEYRRQGIARDLLCRLLDDAKACGCGVVQVTASDAGVPLYNSVGFSHNKNFLQIGLTR